MKFSFLPVLLLVNLISFGQTSIDFNLDDLENYRFEDLFSSIEIVQLKTNSSSLIGDKIFKISANDKILVVLTGDVIIFSRSGEFIKKIPRGRGPGEIFYPLDIIVDEGNRIHILDFYNKISVFSDSACLLQEISLPVRSNYFEKLSNGNYLLYSFSDNIANHYLFEFDFKEDKIINKYIEGFKYGKPGMIWTFPFSSYHNNVYLIPQIGDTLYCWDHNSVLSKIALRFGDDQLPSDFYNKQTPNIPSEALFNARETNKVSILYSLRCSIDRLSFVGIKGPNAYLFIYDKNENIGYVNKINYITTSDVMLNTLIGALVGNTDKEEIYYITSFELRKNLLDITTTFKGESLDDFINENYLFFELSDSMDDTDNPIVFFLK